MRKLLVGLVGLVSLLYFYSCQKEVSLEYGSEAIGSLQGAGGDCLPKLVAGSYVAGKPVNDSNFLDVTVDVAIPGPYSITTDTVNGIVFKAAGTLPTIGTSIVKLQAFGVPVDEGDYTYQIIFDSTWCEVTVSFLPAGSTGGPAVFTLDGAPGACTAIGLNGSFVKDTVLDSSNNIQVNIDVATVGTYTISTNTVNGYSFSGTGTFGATGPAQVYLYATGTPQAAGTDNFSVTAGTSTCTFPVSVTANTTNPGGPCGATAQGTYTAGTALAAGNTIVISHTYTNAGPYTVSTNTANGFSFGPATITATAGTATNITLTGTGTPTAAGTNTFTISFGDGQTCTFDVTVSPAAQVNPDYFPIAANNWWSYTFTGAGAADSFTMKVVGPVNIGANTYQHFGWFAEPNNPADPSFDDYYYRKDAAGNYYEGMDTTGFGPEVTFSQPNFEVKFLKNSMTTGEELVSDFPVNLDFPGIYTGPAILRYKYTCVNNNATLTTATGRTLNNVYEVHFILQVDIAGQVLDFMEGPIKTFYAKGIGQVKYLSDADSAAVYQELIRHWQVN